MEKTIATLPHFEKEFHISSFDTDIHGRAKITTLCNFLQEIANNHVNSLQCGIDHLASNNLAWVLSRLSIKVDRLPHWKENIRIQTWPVGIEGPFALRDFRILDKKNQIISKATSAWLVVKISNRRPQNPMPIVKKMMLKPDRSIVGEKPKKIPQLNTPAKIEKYRVHFSDLDINQHVNNVKYIKWLVDCCPQDVQINSSIKELEINFLHEAKLGDHLEIFRETDGKDLFFVSVRDVDTNIENCRGKIVWTDIQ